MEFGDAYQCFIIGYLPCNALGLRRPIKSGVLKKHVTRNKKSRPVLKETK